MPRHMHRYLYIPLTLVYIDCVHEKDRRLCVGKQCVDADHVLVTREGRQTQDKGSLRECLET